MYLFIYLANKPLSVAGISEDNAQSLLGQLFIFRTIFQPRALSSDIPASRKGVYLFYDLPNNFSRRTYVDRSSIFCGFFRVSRYGIVNQIFI